MGCDCESHHIHCHHFQGKLRISRALGSDGPGRRAPQDEALAGITGFLQCRQQSSASDRARRKTMTNIEISGDLHSHGAHFPRQVPTGCASCSNRRPGWFCSLGSAVLADLELATSTIALPAQASLFTQGEDARCLYLICSGYLKLTAGRREDKQMIVRVAGPGSMLGLYAVLSHGVYEVSAESLTSAQLRPVERDPVPEFPAQPQGSADACCAVHLPGIPLCAAGRMPHRAL